MGQHEVNVGARVKSRDGKKLGTIKQLIVHPGTYRVDGFILGKGILSEHKIVAGGSRDGDRKDRHGPLHETR